MRATPARLLFPLLLAAGACTAGDIGQPCPQLLQDGSSTPAGDGTVLTQDVVGFDPTFPCDSLTCVATAGRSGYCSRQCRDASACPRAFECRVIQPVGEFARDAFCAWKPCQNTSDCGPASDYCCRTVPGSDPAAPLKYCDFANGDCE